MTFALQRPLKVSHKTFISISHEDHEAFRLSSCCGPGHAFTRTSFGPCAKVGGLHVLAKPHANEDNQPLLANAVEPNNLLEMALNWTCARANSMNKIGNTSWVKTQVLVNMKTCLWAVIHVYWSFSEIVFTIGILQLKTLTSCMSWMKLEYDVKQLWKENLLGV